MGNDTTIVLKKEIKQKLDKIKIIPQEPYNDVIERLLEKFSENRSKNKKLAIQ